MKSYKELIETYRQSCLELSSFPKKGVRDEKAYLLKLAECKSLRDELKDTQIRI